MGSELTPIVVYAIGIIFPVATLVLLFRIYQNTKEICENTKK